MLRLIVGGTERLAVILMLGATASATADDAVGAAVPSVAPTAPFEAPLSAINSGDTAWMLACTALVLLMTIPGLALFFAGMVHKKNVLATALQSLVICGLVTVLRTFIGHEQIG